MNERRYEIVLLKADEVITRYGATFHSNIDARTQATSLNGTLDREGYPLVLWVVRFNPFFKQLKEKR